MTGYQRRSLEQRERAASRPTAGRSDKLTRQFESAKAKAGEADARWRQLSGMIGQPYGKDTVTQAHVEAAAREQEAAKLQFEALKANVRSAGIPLDASGEGIDYDALSRAGSGRTSSGAIDYSTAKQKAEEDLTEYLARPGITEADRQRARAAFQKYFGQASTSQTISAEEYQQAIQKHGQAAVDGWLRGKGISVAGRAQGARETGPSRPARPAARGQDGGHKVGDIVTVNGKQVRIGKIYPDGSFDPE